MKYVILAAGASSRFNQGYNKTLAKVGNTTILEHIVSGVADQEIIVLVGYDADNIKELLAKKFPTTSFTFVHNDWSYKTNNLYSLWLAKEYLIGNEFITINGDLIFDHRILNTVLDHTGAGVAVSTNTSEQELDYPKAFIDGGLIYDLKRGTAFNWETFGYAIGIYKFSEELSTVFFTYCDGMPYTYLSTAGFHDPIYDLVEFYNQAVYPIDIGDYLWTDVDTTEDLLRANKYIKEIYKCQTK